MKHTMGTIITFNSINYVSVYDNTEYCDRCVFKDQLITSYCFDCQDLKIVWVEKPHTIEDERK